jgi:hypothetical protein
LRSVWVAVSVLLAIFLLLSLTSGTATIASIAKGFSLLSACFLSIPVLFTVFTYIAVDKKELKSVKWLFMRTSILVSRIQSIRCQKSFVGLVTNVDVFYVNEGGQLSHTTIGTVEAYGAATISKILNELLKVNTSIKLDESAEGLKNRR